MNQRGARVERPFAQLNQIMGMRRVPCWGNTGANAERGRAVLAYTLTPMIHELGVQRSDDRTRTGTTKTKKRAPTGVLSASSSIFTHSHQAGFFYAWILLVIN